MKKKKRVTKGVTKKIKGAATITFEPFDETPRKLTDVELELVKWLFK